MSQNEKQQVQTRLTSITDSNADTALNFPLTRDSKHHDHLTTFRTVTDITPLSSLHNRPPRPAPNIGLYPRLISAEKWWRIQYYLYSTILNTRIILQIIFAATLTALGALASPHAAITLFVAVNTAVAGILALMKGQGLLNRLTQGWMELRPV
jgi:hypothetical protein